MVLLKWKSVFVVFVDGCHQLVQYILDGGIGDLCAGRGGIAAAAQRLQDHLNIGGADASGRYDDRIAVGVQHEGCADAGNIQQFIGGLGSENTGSGGVQGSQRDLLPV